jgi:hypothetical protein
LSDLEVKTAEASVERSQLIEKNKAKHAKVSAARECKKDWFDRIEAMKVKIAALKKENQELEAVKEIDAKLAKEKDQGESEANQLEDPVEAKSEEEEAGELEDEESDPVIKQNIEQEEASEPTEIVQDVETSPSKVDGGEDANSP